MTHPDSPSACAARASAAARTTMFGFLTPAAKETTDPLASVKGVTAWLRELPAQDVIGRQQSVMRAFDEMRQSRRPVDPGRVAGGPVPRRGARRRPPPADQAVRRERRRRAPSCRARCGRRSFDMSQGFIYAYQCALDEALRQSANPRWKAQVPILFARLLHYYGTDAKLRVFRFERWIPGKWMELHRTYVRAAELGIDRVPTALAHAGPKATQWTIEQEYLFVLLIHQLNTGNLSPLELDWASAQLRALEPPPRARRGAALDGRLLRRPRRQAGHGPPHRPAIRARCCATSTRRRSPSSSSARSPRCARREDTDSGPARADQPAARRGAREGAARGRAEPQRRPAPRSAHRVPGRRARARRPVAHRPRADRERRRRRGQRSVGRRPSRSRSTPSPTAPRIKRPCATSTTRWR